MPLSTRGRVCAVASAMPASHMDARNTQAAPLSISCLLVRLGEHRGWPNCVGDPEEAPGFGPAQPSPSHCGHLVNEPEDETSLSL